MDKNEVVDKLPWCKRNKTFRDVHLWENNLIELIRLNIQSFISFLFTIEFQYIFIYFTNTCMNM